MEPGSMSEEQQASVAVRCAWSDSVPSMQSVELSWAHGAGQAAEMLVVSEGG